MAKSQYNVRLEQSAIAAYKRTGKRLGVSVSNVMEALIYWMDGDVRSLDDMPIDLREAIAEVSGSSGATTSALSPELEARLSAIEAKLEER